MFVFSTRQKLCRADILAATGLDKAVERPNIDENALSNRLLDRLLDPALHCWTPAGACWTLLLA